MLRRGPNSEGVVRAAVFIADHIDVSFKNFILQSSAPASPHGDVFTLSIEYLKMKMYLIAAALLLAATTAARTVSPPQAAAVARTFSMAQEMWSTGICTLN